MASLLSCLHFGACSYGGQMAKNPAVLFQQLAPVPTRNNVTGEPLTDGTGNVITVPNPRCVLARCQGRCMRVRRAVSDTLPQLQKCTACFSLTALYVYSALHLFAIHSCCKFKTVIASQLCGLLGPPQQHARSTVDRTGRVWCHSVRQCHL